MLGRIFNKDKAALGDPPEGAALELEAGAGPEQVEAAPASAVDWQLRLQAAMGDDTALLALTREGAPVDVKMAAVSALTSEAALKLAEREHRGHDRRVHRLAKQRHTTQVATRETGELAAGLIEAAEALVKEPLVPANRLVELDRAWQALNTPLLDATQRTRFNALQAQLAALTLERGDLTLKNERWRVEARRALAHLHAACSAAAAGTQDRNHLAAAAASAQAVLESASAQDAGAALRDSLHGALQICAQLDERLAVLDELQQAPSAARPAPLPELPTSGAVAEPAATPLDPALRWLQLPPLADADLVDALNHRFEQWQQAREQARQARRTERRERALERERGVRKERTETLATALERAEAALAAGHLADTHKHLLEVDELLHGGAAAASLHSRIDAVQAEYTRLKGWQHWGGGLARDELVLQAEALAAATLGEPGAEIVKLSIRQQAEVIDDLRARWKELDRLGGATSRSLWQRFDAALKTAYRPVAVHLDVQRAAREQNLQKREQIVDALNAVALPDPEKGDVAPDWKSLAIALERLQTEWRKLGPLEHTVPHKERGKLVERMGAAVLRLEAPLNEARRGAELNRERLVARAKTLASEASAGAQGRELVAKVRELQAEWQHLAAALPLARAVENALWSRFKTDIDAIFRARDAVFSARDAEFKAHGAERAALIERLTALTADTPPAELKRTLAEVDARWQRAGPAPRSDASALDSRFRSARDNARRFLAGRAQHDWHATCDALLAKLVLCEEFEQTAGSAEAKATLEQCWAVQPVLPALWEQALARRAGLIQVAHGGGSPITATADDLLLQLEAAFQLDSPPAFEAARRELKLRALKAALEGRQSTASAPLAPDKLMAAVLGRTALDDRQHERLGKVIAALRDRGPTGAG
jgi:exonuclease SbcC